MTPNDINPAAAEVADFLQRHPQTRAVDAILFDLCGNAVGKRYPIGDLEKLYSAGPLLCAGTLLLDVIGMCWDVAGSGFSDGDPDTDGVILPGTLAPVPWRGDGLAQCLFELKDPTDPTGLWFDPRAILKRVVARLHASGLRPVVACELEFYLLNAAREPDGSIATPPVPRTGRVNAAPRVFNFEKLDEFGDFIADIDAACRAQNVPAGASSSEYGSRQYEVNLEHLDDPVRACDHALMLRRIVKGVAQARGMDATFLSKPFGDQPGNGLHIHMSLLDPSGANLFDETRPDGARTLRHAVAGMQATMYDAMALFAPNINAYRRFEVDNFVPVNTAWGENNRSVAFRIPKSSPTARRIEHRVAGAEANPYLVMAAVLAGAHYGLANGLTPTAPATGNAGEAMDPALPAKLWTAVDRLRGSEILADYLGARYPAAYAEVKAAEFDAFLSEALPREYDWYL